MSDDELRIKVAELLGWRCEKMPHGLESWISPDGKQYAQPPELTTDLVLTLPFEDGVKIEVIFFEDGGQSIDFFTPFGKQIYHEDANASERANAMFRGWVKLKT